MLSSLSEYSLQVKDPSGRMQCGPGWRRTRDNSLNLSDAEFWLVWKGSGKMVTRERTLLLFPGFCTLMRPGGIYDAEHDENDPLGITFVHFDLLLPNQPNRVVTADVCQTWPEFFTLDDLAFFDSTSRRIVQRFEQSPDAAEMLLRGLLAELLQCPVMSNTSPDDDAASAHRRRILRLVEEIESGSTSPEISVGDMADMVHLSPSHFSRLFRKTTDQSPLQFLLNLRLSRARHLLRETDLTVGEIADQLGYRDLFFFSRQFIQKEGISPTQYRSRK